MITSPGGSRDRSSDLDSLCGPAHLSLMVLYLALQGHTTPADKQKTIMWESNQTNDVIPPPLPFVQCPT